jgi:hypothetical protein
LNVSISDFPCSGSMTAESIIGSLELSIICRSL